MILILNCGSSSLKFKLYDIDGNLISDGELLNISSNNSKIKYNNYLINKKIECNIKVSKFYEAIVILEKILTNKKIGIITNLSEIKIIGHRFVHGGDKYREPVLCNDSVLKYLEEISDFNITHFSNSIDILKVCQKDFKGAYNLLVFDTSFHSTIPEENYTYPLPRELMEKYHIKKYGFHGISYSYVLEEYKKLENNQQPNVVICHLGGGSSICAVKDGKSYDTTMGLTPTSGLIMSSRCGDLDPLISAYILEREKMSFSNLYKLFSELGGLYALFGSKDAKKLSEKCQEGDKKAIMAKKIICLDFKKKLLSMMSSYSKLDSIILTGGLGCKNIYLREKMMENLDFFGIKIDDNENKNIVNEVGIISKKDSPIKVYIIPTNEEYQIYKECKKILKKQQ